jgi:hypothetical protein
MIREMTPERIYTSLTTGSMQMQAEGFSEGQKRVVAEFMSGRTLGSAAVGDAKNMPNKCPSNPAMSDPARGPAWNGWSADIEHPFSVRAVGGSYRRSGAPIEGSGRLACPRE